MRLEKLGENRTLIKYGEVGQHGREVLFSYNTPVAAYDPELGWIKTNRKYSKTTSKHITQYLGKTGKEVDQSVIDGLVK